MARYEVIVPQECTVYWRYTVEASSEEEAIERCEEGREEGVDSKPVEIDSYKGNLWESAEVHEIEPAAVV